MADTRPEPSAKATGNRPMSPETRPGESVRQRTSIKSTGRQEASPSPRPPILDRRRSSLMSFSSLDDVTRALADDIINPSTSRHRVAEEVEQVTHWHSTPLAFAILPAVGGLLFKNGSAFVTDVLLLGLAAIFMNWSIRLPWDWYYSAQEQQQEMEPDYFSSRQDLDDDDVVLESTSSLDGSPPHSTQDETILQANNRSGTNQQREEAAAELRRQEILALCSTFVLPVLAAYLLHVIRGQLSPSSTSLVSDYNLSIFLLAAEVRPFRQLVRLISSRTLHLQRTVRGLNDPYGSAVEEKNILANLTTRISEMEAKLAENTVVPHNLSLAQKEDVSDLSAEMKKRYEPRLEGLERAVRRYEKRSTAFAMLVEQRFTQLDTRLQDALSLAAVAAQHSGRGSLGRLTDSIVAAIVWPLTLMRQIIMSPIHVLDDLYAKIRSLFSQKATQSSAKRSTSRQVGAKPSKTKEELNTRKTAR